MDVKRRRLVPPSGHQNHRFRCIYTSEVASKASCAPLNTAYTRAKWTWAHSGLLRDPSQPCIDTSEVNLGVLWAQNGSSKDSAETCIYTSEVDMGPF